MDDINYEKLYMINKILIILWFIRHPKFYLHFFSLIKRKFLFDHDTIERRSEARKWASLHSISYNAAFKKLDMNGKKNGLDVDIINKANKILNKSSTIMGGSAHVNLLYDSVKILNAKKVVETGVAYGWSSLAILLAFKDKKDKDICKLFSVDMPYPLKKNEKDVGILVPKYLRKQWVLIRKPDNPGLVEALKLAKNQIDLCHYDSDKSWWGRHFAYPILWRSLKSKGLFISDDIQDNLYFYEFVKKKRLKFAVIKLNDKFIGLIRKP